MSFPVSFMHLNSLDTARRNVWDVVSLSLEDIVELLSGCLNFNLSLNLAQSHVYDDPLLWYSEIRTRQALIET
ncbi:hypothetical protein ACFX2G_011121 [Malus domestica]